MYIGIDKRMCCLANIAAHHTFYRLSIYASHINTASVYWRGVNFDWEMYFSTSAFQDEEWDDWVTKKTFPTMQYVVVSAPILYQLMNIYQSVFA